MKTTRVLISIIWCALALALPLALIGFVTIGPGWDVLTAWLGAPWHRLLVLGGSGLFVLLAFAVAVLQLIRPAAFNYIAFNNASGVVRITTPAVKDFIKKTGEEFAAVIKMDPGIQAHKGAVTVELDIAVKEGNNIPQLCELLQNRIKERLQNDLGIADVREVRVNIRQIVSSAASVA